MSRFVSAGTNEEPTERDEAWSKAEEQIDAIRRNKAEIGKQADGKSLYETLQANKAAKQEAFEESIRLRNQFRSLDEDEVEFLDSVLESERAKEARIKQETAYELEAYRKQQEEAGRAVNTATPTNAIEDVDSVSWAVGKKRKKGREDLLGRVKLRKMSTAEEPSFGLDKAATLSSTMSTSASAGLSRTESNQPSTPTKPAELREAEAGSVSPSDPVAKPSSPAPTPNTGLGLGLGAYSSDDED